MGPRGKGRRKEGGKEGREWRKGEGRGGSPGMSKSRVGKPTVLTGIFWVLLGGLVLLGHLKKRVCDNTVHV